MQSKYDKHISKEYLQHCQHSFDTQVNEGMNNSVASYANKGKHYGGTSSLLTRVYISAGIQLVGYHHFWTACLTALEVEIPRQLQVHLLQLDKVKVARYHRDHDFKNKAKRKRLEHEKFTKEYQDWQKDVARNATYASRTGCDDNTPSQPSQPSQPPPSTCIHSAFGCDGKKGHKTARSKHCVYHSSKLGGMTIVEAQNTWKEKNYVGTCTYKSFLFLITFSIQNLK